MRIRWCKRWCQRDHKTQGHRSSLHANLAKGFTFYIPLNQSVSLLARDGPSVELRSKSAMDEEEGGQELHFYFFLLLLSPNGNYERIDSTLHPNNLSRIPFLNFRSPPSHSKTPPSTSTVEEEVRIPWDGSSHGKWESMIMRPVRLTHRHMTHILCSGEVPSTSPRAPLLPSSSHRLTERFVIL
jgi:hypothetical protein